MNVVAYLNKTVYCTLGASPIKGVGVFAIRDIPEGQELTDYYGQDIPVYGVIPEEFEFISSEVQTLIKQRTIFRKCDVVKFNSPNSLQILEAFMNHSDNPNSDGKFTLRDIKKGEEITKDYSVFLDDPHTLNADILKI